MLPIYLNREGETYLEVSDEPRSSFVICKCCLLLSLGEVWAVDQESITGSLYWGSCWLGKYHSQSECSSKPLKVEQGPYINHKVTYALLFSDSLPVSSMSNLFWTVRAAQVSHQQWRNASIHWRVGWQQGMSSFRSSNVLFQINTLFILPKCIYTYIRGSVLIEGHRVLLCWFDSMEYTISSACWWEWYHPQVLSRCP